MKKFQEFLNDELETGVQGAGGNGCLNGSSHCSYISVVDTSSREIKPQFQDGNFQSGSWYPETFQQNSSVLAIPQDTFGDWSKVKEKTVSRAEKWMIGLGIGSLIIGIITVLIMLI